MSRYYRSILNVQQVAPSLDPDAEAFLLAAGITDATITTAINNLVLSLKADSLWAKMTALYPLVGGTATTHKFNLKDPRDLDAAFRLTFFGSPTHSADGMQGNGSSQYARTHIIPLSHFSLNSASGFAYINQGGNAGYDFASWGGALYGGGFYTTAYLRTTLEIAITNVHSVVQDSIAGSSSFTGLLGINRNNSTQSQLNVDGTINTFTRNSEDRSRVQIYLMAFNDGGGGSFNNPTGYSNRRYAFFSFGEGLDSTEQGNLKTIIDTFQTALGRA
jgi:hypothetical protein